MEDTFDLDFDQAWRELVQTWEQHQVLRADGAGIAELSASRFELDDRRLRVARRRHTCGH